MAVKTITIDMEAYELLSRHKHGGLSFSEVIKEHFGRIRTGRNLVAALDRIELSDDALDGVERQIEARGESRADATW